MKIGSPDFWLGHSGDPFCCFSAATCGCDSTLRTVDLAVTALSPRRDGKSLAELSDDSNWKSADKLEANEIRRACFSRIQLRSRHLLRHLRSGWRAGRLSL